MEGRLFECLVAREIINVCRYLKMTLTEKKTEEKRMCMFSGGGVVCVMCVGGCQQSEKTRKIEKLRIQLMKQLFL